MSGSGAIVRQRAKVMVVARLKAKGLSNRAIAETLGIRIERVAAMAKLGERLITVEARKL